MIEDIKELITTYKQSIDRAKKLEFFSTDPSTQLDATWWRSKWQNEQYLVDALENILKREVSNV